MSLHEMPEAFVCDACSERLHLELLCTEGSNAVSLYCMRCCQCDGHRVDDPGGHAVLAGTPLTWRGLHDSEHRTRRHA